MLRIHLLGNFRVFQDEQPLAFSALPKVLPLWAYLLLKRAAPILRDALAFTLWPDVPETEARSNLRRHLYDLRRVLPAAPDALPWVLSERETVQWNPDSPYWLDVADFERLSAEPAGWAEAANHYTGDLLPQLYDDWLIAERERLREKQLDTLARLAAQRQADHDLAQATDYARKLLALDPMREEMIRVLMRVRHEAGDRTGALREYQAFEARLREELAVAPMPETRELFEQIRTNAPARPAPSAPSPARPSIAPPNNLPATLTSFLGRAEELAALQHMREAGARLITLTGPGGSGKTRLALEAARRALNEAAGQFPQGVFFIRLADITDPAFVPSAIANELGVKEGQRTVTQGLVDFLRPKQVLLVLDNFEQIVEAAALISDLLSAAPGLRVFATSRTVLNLYGEHEFPVSPLPLPDLAQLPPLSDLMNFAAVALFVERARAVQPGFALTVENAAIVVEICHRLDGLPLALELAAARSKLFAPAAMLERLSERLNFLTSAARNLAARQRTLRQTIDWSYHLLDEAEQRWFEQLGVFTGSFTAEAAQAITGQPMLEALSGLADKSMLRRLPPSELPEAPRFRLLLTLREYALEQLAARNEIEPARERHAGYYRALAERAEPELEGTAQVAWLERLDREYDNLRAALEWGRGAEAATLARLAAALWRFWMVRGHYTEGRLWLAAALEQARAGALGASLHAQVLRASGDLAWRQGEYDQAREFYQASLALSRAADDLLGLSRSLRGLGFTAYRQADYGQARAFYEESLALQRHLNSPQDIAHLLNNLALVDQRQGDYAAAQPLFEESLALQRKVGNQQGIANVLNNLGVVALEQGRLEASRAYLEECLVIQRALGDKQALAQSFSNLGNVAQAQGRPAEARLFFDDGVRLAREIGARWSLAQLLLAAGQLHHRLGEVEAARATLSEALALHHEAGDKRGIASDLEGLALVASQALQPALAAQLFGAAEALRAATRAARAPSESAELKAGVARLRPQLPPADFAEAWEAGRALTLEQAIGLAQTTP